MRRRLGWLVPVAVAASFWLARNLILDILFGSAGEWTKENTGVVGDFIDWRWSPLAVSLVALVAYVLAVVRWNQIASFVVQRLPTDGPVPTSTPILDASNSASRTFDIELGKYSVTMEHSKATVMTIETSLRPSHPMELARVELLVYRHEADESPLEIDELREEKPYLDNPLPKVLEMPGVYPWSFELPTKVSDDYEFVVRLGRLAFLADGKWWVSGDLDVQWWEPKQEC